MLDELRTRVAKRRILVKPIFTDGGKGVPRSVFHMTPARFRRGVKMLAPDLSTHKVDMLIQKFEDHDRLVNFAAFLAIIGAPGRTFLRSRWRSSLVVCLWWCVHG